MAASTCGTSAQSSRAARVTRFSSSRTATRHEVTPERTTTPPARPRSSSSLGPTRARARPSAGSARRTRCRSSRPMPARTGSSAREGSPSSSPQSDHVVAVIVLDSIGSRNPPRLEIAGDGPRSPAPGARRHGRGAAGRGDGHRRRRCRARSRSSSTSAFPFSLTEQYPFLAEHIPALTVTTEGSRAEEDPRPRRLDRGRSRPGRPRGRGPAGVARREPRAGEGNERVPLRRRSRGPAAGQSPSSTSRCSCRSSSA